MNTLHFDEPVYLTVGLGALATVDSVERAYALLNECPSWQRNPEHEVALNACKAALAGDIDLQTARSTLAAFASRLEGGPDAQRHWEPGRVFTRINDPGTVTANRKLQRFGGIPGGL